MAEVVLVYPKSVEARHHWMPWSVLGIARAVEDRWYTCHVWDQRVEEESALWQVIDRNPAFVGISVMVGAQITNGLALAKRIRMLNPLAPLVWGGPFITAAPEVALGHPLVDAVVVGAGELWIREILRDSHDGRKTKLYGDPGVQNLRPYPGGWPRVNVPRYINPVTKALAYVSSVGCTHGCRFCRMGGGWHSAPVEETLDDLGNLIRAYDLSAITFQDANFFPSPTRVIKLCQGFIDRQFSITWHANGRADQLSRYHPKTLALMERSGCRLVIIGVETASPKLIPLIGKQENTKDVEAFVQHAVKFSFGVNTHFIFGLPGEVGEDTMDSIRFYWKLKRLNEKVYPTVHFYLPTPGVPLLDDVISAGYTPPATFEEWGKHDWLTIDHCTWIPPREREGIGRLVSEYLAREDHGRGTLL